jgi:hypothetical protein
MRPQKRAHFIYRSLAVGNKKRYNWLEHHLKGDNFILI